MSKTDPKAWAKESYALRKFVYSPPVAASRNPDSTIQHHAITPEYAAKARTIAEKQIVYAGYRLAKLLNSIYIVK
jgi:hypothetical protein